MFEKRAALIGEGLGITTVAAWIEPATTGFFVDASAPPAVLGGIGVDLNLIAMNPTGGDFDRFASSFKLGGLVKTLAADLHAGIQLGIHLEFVFEDKIAVVARRAKKAVWCVGLGGADNAAVFNSVGCFAAALDPAIKVGAVEKRSPGIGSDSAATSGGE